MSVEIFVARHGQNEDNAQGILNGHRDLPLTELGRQHAHGLGQGILDNGLTFDAVYSSPLSRALETAQITSAVASLPSPKILPDLIERNFGVMTGEQASDIEKLCAPDIMKVEGITYFFDVEGAETFPQLIERAKRVIHEIKSRHKDGRVLVVCHGDIGKMIYAVATGTGWKEALTGFHFGNGDLIDVSGNGEVHTIKLEQSNH